MSRFTWLFALIWMTVACHSGTGGSKDASADTDVAPASSEGVKCPNIFKPAKTLTCEGESPVCCMKGQFMTPACAADVKTCGQDSRLACDDAADCGAEQSCCLLEINTGKQVFIATCKAKCTLAEKPMCTGPNTCASGQTCCLNDGDIWGTCVKDGQACPVDTSR